MGWMLSRAFDAKRMALKVITTLFVLNSLGYFIGGWVEGTVIGMKQLSLFGNTFAKPAQVMLAKSLWGVCYGIGFGAGLGLAFHFCQTQTRDALDSIGRQLNAVTKP